MTQQKMTCCSEPTHPAGQKRKASVKQTEKDTAQVPGPKVSFVHGDFRWEPPVLTFQLAEQARPGWERQEPPFGARNDGPHPAASDLSSLCILTGLIS